MKEYNLVYLNKGFNLSREKDVEQAEAVINEHIAEGWELQQIVAPSDLGGALIGVFYRDK